MIYFTFVYCCTSLIAEVISKFTLFRKYYNYERKYCIIQIKYIDMFENNVKIKF